MRYVVLALLMMVSMGVRADIDVVIGEFTGGVIDEVNRSETDGGITVTIHL